MKKRVRKGTVSYVILKATEARMIAESTKGLENFSMKDLQRLLRNLKRSEELVRGLIREAIILEIQGEEGAVDLERLVNRALTELEAAKKRVLDVRLLKFLLG